MLFGTIYSKAWPSTLKIAYNNTINPVGQRPLLCRVTYVSVMANIAESLTMTYKACKLIRHEHKADITSRRQSD